jgi:hypothetical protein
MPQTGESMVKDTFIAQTDHNVVSIYCVGLQIHLDHMSCPDMF